MCATPSNSNLNDSQISKQSIQRKSANGVEKSQSLLKLIIQFWKDNLDKVIVNKMTFPEKDIIPLLQQLVKIKKEEMELRNVDLYFCMFEDPKKEQCAKQAFWLNILNYMTLFRFAEIFLIQPKLAKELTSYAMWQSFWVNNLIYIKGCKVS